MGVKSKVLDKMGAWYSYKGTQLGQGREKTKAYLEVHPEEAKEIEDSIREKLLSGEVIVCLSLRFHDHTDLPFPRFK